MAVRLHGPARRELPPPVSTLPALPTRSLRRVHPSAPSRLQSPWTVGRVTYFVVLMVLVVGAVAWAADGFRAVRSVGIIERDIDRLSPRERARIARIGVAVGDRVKQGQPLAWLDYSAEGGAGSGYVSDSAMRIASHRGQRDGLLGRRHEVERQVATTKSVLAGLRATAQGLRARRDQLQSSQEATRRLVEQGAATAAELGQFALQLAELEQERNVAVREATEQERVLEALGREARQVEETLVATPELQAPADEGIIKASRDGVVALISRHPGEMVGPEDAVILLADPLKVVVRAFVEPKDAASMSANAAAEIELPSGESLRGRVETVQLLASLGREPGLPQLGKNSTQMFSPNPAPPVDPKAAFLVANVSVTDVPDHLVGSFIAGSPCEVRVKRLHRWLPAFLGGPGSSRP